ncbi:cytochrome c [Tabrizicola sp. J26]|uniref:c-type cytochrome n=1 Tax=Alitabrizicola rongguiensis TaxID=2909234 RepID=UPI001F46768D|nr:cytochrome c [Tabrizicola rongguiensis]MCF1709340.1 cytochrome c [Tabrizicola rongguiensis]
MKIQYLATTVVWAALANSAIADEALVARGAYLARIMDCAGCHMPRNPQGMPIEEAGLSGGTVGFEIPGLGIFWPPNLTPDASGLGGWSQADIATALRTGTRPDGRILAPAMPWPSYAALSDDDMQALTAYLASMPAVSTERLDPVVDAKAARAPFYKVVLPGQSGG